MGRGDRWVVPHDSGGWDVKAPGTDRASSHHGTQAGAIDRAREIIHNQGGGELIVQNREGQIRQKDTIAPAHDPFPPKG